MRIIDVKQGSDAWFEARMGIPTASEFSNLVTDLLKPRKPDSDMVESYLAKKLAERWRGQPLLSWSGGAMEQGTIKESDAIPWYELEHGVEVKRVGFVTTDDGKIGCSPDGLLPNDCGIEIKCPEPHTHVKYLLDGTLPKCYAAQVQGSMLVTGFKRWMFLSYCPGFPPLVLDVFRDDKAQEALQEALDDFNAKLDAGYARLLELNGGPPEPRVTHTPSEAKLDELLARPPIPGQTPEEVAASLQAAGKNLDDLGL